MGKSAVNISINGRKLKVGCPSGDESALIAASTELDNRLNTMLSKGNFESSEQALLMTALNLSNDLLALKKQIQQEKENNESKIALLQSTIEHALSDHSIKRA